MALPAQFACASSAADGAPTRLHVYLKQARDLPAVDKSLMGKASSDPMVTFAVVDAGLRSFGSATTCASTVKKKSLAPTWNEQFSLAADDDERQLLAVVDDYDLVGSNDFMGCFVVPLADLRDQETTTACSAACDEPNCVRVCLLRARGLPIMDTNLLSKGGSSDPIVTFEAGGTRVSSTVKKKDLDPIWREDFTLEVERDQTVSVLVEDQDVASGNDFMGRFDVDVAAIFDLRGEPRRAWHALLDRRGDPGIGKVELVVVAAHDPALAVPTPAAMLEAEAKPGEAPNCLSDLASGNDFMGDVRVGLESLADRNVHRAWHALRSKAGDTAQGSVELCLRWWHDPSRSRALPTPPPMVAEESHPGEEANAIAVHLLRAKGLAVMDRHLLSKGGSSDPLVTLELGGEKRSSTCKPKCLAPTWQEGFVLPAEDGAGELVVTVWDQDLASGNDFMGVARVDLEALAHRRVHRAWYPLQAKGGGAAKGSVELALRRIHDPALALPTPPAMLADEAHADEAANCVDVHLLRARDLPIMDRHLLGKGGSSDPVATVEVAGAKQSSTCKKKSLAPVWQESFSLAADGDDALAVTLWDEDLASGNDFMGEVRVDLESLADRRPRRSWHPLRGRDGAVAQGAVELCVRWRHDPALALPTPPAMLEAEAQPDEAPNCVAIHLVRAKGLPVMDKNLLSKGGSSDPVVTFALPGAETQTSTCKAKCLAPRWREDFALAADDAAGEALVVTVFDQDLASGNDFMGAVEVPLAALGDRAVHRAWHPLRSKAGEAAPGAVGPASASISRRARCPCPRPFARRRRTPGSPRTA
ncbi:hypothetical protein JL721_363 [Aureococcus anophagefferens]|nr:hypothetical protein JL721_363 [Aureococcus anophagefferens]